MLGKLKAWFLALSTASKIGVIAGASVLGVATASSGNTPPAPKCVPSSNVTYSSQTQDISFKNTDVPDSTLAKGTTKITTPGANGEEIIKNKVIKYVPSGCKPDDYLYDSTTRVKDPVNQITAVGTYETPAPSPAPTPAPTTSDQSCPNGTYTNTYGNVVCSPYSSPTAPAGATAQCNDGTYSFSQSRSGTCSHHGGVSQWL